MANHILNDSLKTMGLVAVNPSNLHEINSDKYKPYLRIIYLPEGGQVRLDFNVLHTSEPALFFAGPNQLLNVKELRTKSGYFIFFNHDFYCIQIRQEEVMRDEVLFNNLNDTPMTVVPDQEATFIKDLFTQIDTEFRLKDTSLEEMLRTYLKQLLIKASRLWKQQQLDSELPDQMNDLHAFRQFTRLVDTYYKQKHMVADYADLMLIAPKTLTQKFKRMNLPPPNEVIKNRILLEAKRLLVNTGMSAKEIAYELGYEDPAYFSRIFFIKTGVTPSGFKTKYLLPAAINKNDLLAVA